MGRDGRKTKEKEVMHIVKNAVWFAFYCVQVRVCKKAEPVQVVGLADWLTTDLMDSRSPPLLITKVTAVCTQPAGAVLSWDQSLPHHHRHHLPHLVPPLLPPPAPPLQSSRHLPGPLQ